MADGGPAQLGASNGGTDLVDVRDNLIRVGADASVGLDAVDRVPVQILAADRDADHQLSQIISVLGNGGLEGSDFVGEVSTGSPQAEQKGGLLGDGGRDSRNGGVGGASLLVGGSVCDKGMNHRQCMAAATHNHGVQAGTGEAGSAHQVLGRREFGLEVSLGLGAAVGLGIAIVEALVSGLGGGERESKRNEVCELHLGRFGETKVCRKDGADVD